MESFMELVRLLMSLASCSRRGRLWEAVCAGITFVDEDANFVDEKYEYEGLVEEMEATVEEDGGGEEEEEGTDRSVDELRKLVELVVEEEARDDRGMP